MINKWTIGLAAVGAVSLASVASADEQTNTLASLSSTVLSGYVDTSMQWNLFAGSPSLLSRFSGLPIRYLHHDYFD